MLIAILADTHLPRGARRLPDGCVERLEAADLILHAGDFVRTEVLRELERYGDVLAVHGNIDEPALRKELPAHLDIEVSPGLGIAMLHDAGPSQGRLERMRLRFPKAAAVVFGHSHIPLHERSSREDFQIFNPGSPTDRRRQPHHTMGMARLDETGISFELLELD